MKKCTTCQVEKELNCFNKKNTTKDGLQNVCRECNRLRSQKYYEDNRDKHCEVIRIRNKAIRKQNKEFVDSIRSSGCIICGEKSLCCLDFHHLDKSSKEFGISNMISGYSIEKIKNEISKCIIVCSNCHRKIHANEIKVPPERIELS